MRHGSVFFQPEHLSPSSLERNVVGGPVQLIEIDPLDTEPSQGVLALPADVGRGPPGVRAIGVADDAALCEHERPLFRTERFQRPRDDLLGMSVAVNGGRVDPVNPPFHRMPDRGDAVGVVRGPHMLPPMAQAPKPTRVMSRPVRPKARVGKFVRMSVSFRGVCPARVGSVDLRSEVRSAVAGSAASIQAAFGERHLWEPPSGAPGPKEPQQHTPLGIPAPTETGRRFGARRRQVLGDLSASQASYSPCASGCSG